MKIWKNCLLYWKGNRDSYGNPAVITADYAVANPDFDKIRKSKFGEYFYESIATTYREYSGSANALNLARQGIKKTDMEATASLP